MADESALMKMRRQRGILIAAHRGMAAGNIPCNTLRAFEAALAQGADMIETDVTRSADGELFIFHPGKERAHLNRDIHLGQMKAEDVRRERYVNFDNDVTECGIVALDEALEALKNRCLINLDHGWECLPETIRAVRRHGMEQQVLIKTPADPKYVGMMEDLAPDIMYMPIIREKDDISPQLEQRKLRYVAAELVFAGESAPVVSGEYIESQHVKGRLQWVNSLLYSYKAPLSAGHSDDVAAAGDPEGGWGWLMDKGFDIIQTDWVLPLRQFMDQRKQGKSGIVC